MQLRHFQKRPSLNHQSQINITPFVDVMLVLLIIFMITAPLLTVGIEVNLPKATLGALNEPAKPIIVTVNASGIVYIGSENIPLENFIPKIQALTQNNVNQPIFLRGDTDAYYGSIMKVIAQLNENGYAKVSLVTVNETKLP